MIRRERRSWRFVVGLVFVTLFALLCIIPLVYMVLVSFADTTTMYIRWEDIRLFDFFNYRYLFENRNFGRPILNSLIVVVISVIAVDLLSCTMAYRSVIGRGTVEILPEGEKKHGLDIIMRHYHAEGFPYSEKPIPVTTVWRLKVESMTGKRRVDSHPEERRWMLPVR